VSAFGVMICGSSESFPTPRCNLAQNGSSLCRTRIVGPRLRSLDLWTPDTSARVCSPLCFMGHTALASPSRGSATRSVASRFAPPR
jgi:hypothetical protein